MFITKPRRVPSYMRVPVSRRSGFRGLGELAPATNWFDFGTNLVNQAASAYIAKKTGTAPAPAGTQYVTTAAPATSAPNWSRVVMVGSLGLLGVAVAMKVMRKRR